jgi:pyrroline-5-carboxylate reductase
MEVCMNIGFIGTGNLGGAIIRALSGQDGLTLYGLNRTRTALQELARETGLVPCADIRELAGSADCIVLAVKPQQAHAVWPELVPALTGDKCLVSLAAGLTRESLRRSTGGICPVVRAMPNSPVLIRQGVTALCFDDATLTGLQKECILAMFGSLGSVHVLREELFDAFTAVIGSGPALVFYCIEAMIEGGVELGLDRREAAVMVKGLFSGASLMAQRSPEHIGLLREMSTAPAGTTTAALAHFDRTAVRGNIMDALRRACDRSAELG